MKKILTLSCLAVMITACTQTDPADIQDISDSSSGTTSSIYTKPPTNISTGSKITSSPSTTTSSSTASQSSSINSSGNNVITTQERLVYNRKYDDIPKGGYQGDSYTVKRGDTLFYIAWVTGNDFRALAAKNNIKEPYSLNVGQVLDVSGGETVVVTQKTTSTNTADIAYTSPTSSQPKPTVTTTTTTTTSSQGQPNKQTTTQTVTEPLSPATTSSASAPITSSSQSNVANILWQWPAKGKIIEKFSNASKGIDIAGSLGDRVTAAADGKVVYSGNALPGYGNLIIIKHNDDYLTAYAHNQSILVKEQQSVRAGEQIATMGATGTSSVRLHFEIRYKAQSVDPLKYLPN